MLARMKFMTLAFAAALLAGCASDAGTAALGRVVQHASGAAASPGGSTGAGSVASGGTGYLPCAVAQGNRNPECK